LKQEKREHANGDQGPSKHGHTLYADHRSVLVDDPYGTGAPRVTDELTAELLVKIIASRIVTSVRFGWTTYGLRF
jgi:hypothetical protein